MMKKHIISLIILGWGWTAFGGCGYAQTTMGFHASVTAIPEPIQAKMLQYTWHVGCPVSIQQLAYLRLSYWGFDEKPHQGDMIVNRRVANDVIDIFRHLYQQRFPIARMELLEDFQGDDTQAMQANDTSSFNCRAITGTQYMFSKHSYGLAIDINPLQNPYVRGNYVIPASRYSNRSVITKGMIAKNSAIYRDFYSKGWHWGGNWQRMQDYQHFEK